MIALVGAFNQEKALVGAFSVIVKAKFEIDGSFSSTSLLVVVDDVQLADAAEVLVQELHVVVDYLQRQKLVVPLLW